MLKGRTSFKIYASICLLNFTLATFAFCWNTGFPPGVSGPLPGAGGVPSKTLGKGGGAKVAASPSTVRSRPPGPTVFTPPRSQVSEGPSQQGSFEVAQGAADAGQRAAEASTITDAETAQRAAQAREIVGSRAEVLGKYVALGSAAQRDPQGQAAKDFEQLAGQPDNIVSEGRQTIGQVFQNRLEWQRRLEEEAAAYEQAQYVYQEKAKANYQAALQLGNMATNLGKSAQGLNALEAPGGDGNLAAITRGAKDFKGGFDFTSARGGDAPSDDTNFDNPLGTVATGVGSLDSGELSDVAKGLLAQNEKAKDKIDLEKSHLDSLKADLEAVRKEDSVLRFVREVGREAGIPELAEVKSLSELQALNGKLEEAGLTALVGEKLASLDDKSGDDLEAPNAATGEEPRDGLAEGPGSSPSGFASSEGIIDDGSDQAMANAVAGMMDGIQGAVSDITSGKKSAKRVAGNLNVDSEANRAVSALAYAPGPEEQKAIDASNRGIGGVEAELFSRMRVRLTRALQADDIRLPPKTTSMLEPVAQTNHDQG